LAPEAWNVIDLSRLLAMSIRDGANLEPVQQDTAA